MKRILVLSFLVFLLTQPLWADDVENEICPVSGEEVSGKHFAEYDGKNYAMCCNGCVRKFNSDPERYTAALEEVESAEETAKEHHQNHDHEGHDHE